MIYVVTKDNRHLFAPEIEEMHRLRKVHFVDERGWGQMNVLNGGEYDECDDSRTIYFLALDDEGRVGVSMRARPTDDRCIVADVFPQLIHPDSGPVKSETTWEISRIFATRKFRTRNGLRRRDEVFLASMEAAVANGVTLLVGIIDTYLLPQAMRFPWRLTPLGLPAAYAEGEMIGVQIPVSREELERVRESMAQEGSIISTAPWVAYRPASSLSEEVGGLVKDRALSQGHLSAAGAAPADLSDATDHVEERRVLVMADQATSHFAQPVAH